MRHSTQNMEAAVTASAEADARLVNRVAALRSWLANVTRHVEERRAQTVADINQTADSMIGELRGLDGELAAIQDELSGNEPGKVLIREPGTLERLLENSDVVIDMTKVPKTG